MALRESLAIFKDANISAAVALTEVASKAVDLQNRLELLDNHASETKDESTQTENIVEVKDEVPKNHNSDGVDPEADTENLNAITERHEEIGSEIEYLRARLDKFIKEQADNDEFHQEYISSLQRSHENAMEYLESEFAEERTEWQKGAEEILELRKKNEKLTVEVNALRKKVGNKNSGVEELEELNALRDLVDRLTGDLDQAKNDIEEKEVEAEGLRNAWEELNEKLTKAKVKALDVLNDLKEKNTKLKEENQRLRKTGVCMEIEEVKESLAVKKVGGDTKREEKSDPEYLAMVATIKSDFQVKNNTTAVDIAAIKSHFQIKDTTTAVNIPKHEVETAETQRQIQEFRAALDRTRKLDEEKTKKEHSGAKVNKKHSDHPTGKEQINIITMIDMETLKKELRSTVAETALQQDMEGVRQMLREALIEDRQSATKHSKELQKCRNQVFILESDLASLRSDNAKLQLICNTLLKEKNELTEQSLPKAAIKLVQENNTLKSKLLSLEPLIFAGVCTRLRYIATRVAALTNSTPSKVSPYWVEAANTAMHRADGEADVALFVNGWVGSKTDATHFELIYGVSWKDWAKQSDAVKFIADVEVDFRATTDSSHLIGLKRRECSMLIDMLLNLDDPDAEYDMLEHLRKAGNVLFNLHWQIQRRLKGDDGYYNKSLHYQDEIDDLDQFYQGEPFDDESFSDCETTSGRQLVRLG